MRKTYGTTWWGRQWLQALTAIDYANRLPRGRTYANKGYVDDLRIAGHRISARVRGSRPRPYQVTIQVPPFPPETQTAILQRVTANPLFLAKLLNRQLPTDLHQACLNQDIHLFPTSWHDLQGTCSCPDWAVPCKHLAAVLYLVAHAIDNNPFLVFTLHDFHLLQALAENGYAPEADQQASIPTVESLRLPFLQAEVTPSFEWDAALYERLDFSQIPDVQKQLLALLPDQAPFDPTGSFRPQLERTYARLAQQLGKRPKALEPERTRTMDAVEHATLVLGPDLEWLTCRLKDHRGKIILAFDAIEGLTEWLDQVPLNQLDKLSTCLRGLTLTYTLAERLARRSALLPQLLSLDDGSYRIRWLPATLNANVRQIVRQTDRLCPRELIFFNTDGVIEVPRPDAYFPTLLSLFLDYLVHRYGRPDNALSFDGLTRLFFHGSKERFPEFERQDHPQAIQLWLSRLFIVEKDVVPVLQVRDIGPAFTVDIAVEDQRHLDQPPIPLAEIFAHEAHRAIRMGILRDLSMLADYFPSIEKILASGGKQPLRLDPEAFANLLFRIIPTIRQFGIRVLLPKGLARLARPQLSMRLQGAEDGKVTSSGIISLEQMLRFQWQVALGDQLVSPEEFLEQVQGISGIVRLNDQYVYLSGRQIKALIDKLENPPRLNGHQLLQVALTESYQGATVQLDEQARQIMQELMKVDSVPLPSGLRASLRPYQLRGYAWLYKNARLGFGSLLADDMGLGKTLQVIAALLKLKEEGELVPGKGLIIVPTTLLTNWSKEIERFAPDLDAHIYHGPGRKLEDLAQADLLLTSYGVVRSEGAKLRQLDWRCVVIDEAQHIKNPSTAQAKAVKKIEAPVRIALTGTPVENRLSEYWSISDFINPAYLGKLREFIETFAKPIEADRDQGRLARFRHLTEPFILRRLKTDKSIIGDLPEKIVKEQFCTLTTKQAALYQSVVEENLKAVQEAEGIDRSGLIFKLMTALKQVCNHPRHFLKKGEVNPALSGKSQSLIELLQQILAGDEKALIFTQYREMGELLAQMIQAEFEQAPPFLHGGVRRKARDAMVEDFQSNRATRIFLLSLKAGGTGLNLTAASHVIHYDLWWNPAVESQATDRAYRIGQTRNVLVHRFITQGTFEERIDQLLQSKKELAELTVRSGERWIGELSNQELEELFGLGRG